MNHTDVNVFYSQQVLPALFERLDSAFPEFGWMRTPCGWVGRRPGGAGRDEVAALQPWGFADASGRATGWLSYVAGTTPADGDFTRVVNKLAGLAGLSPVNEFAPASERRAIQEERQRAILESFVAGCRVALLDGRGQATRDALHRQYGIAPDRVRDLPLGLFTSPQEMSDRLLALGFSREEVVEAWLVGDARLNGRLIIPWRDRWGGIATIVGREIGADRSQARDLYLKGGTKSEAFGLDVALRSSSEGLEHVVLVDELLDVAFFQAHGACNVAAIEFGSAEATLRLWERLAEFGVRTVTLALNDRELDSPAVLSFVRQMNRAKRSPRLFLLPRGHLPGAMSASDYVRQHGLDAFRRLLTQRVHGYRFYAQALVRQHKTGAEWSDAGWINAVREAFRFEAQVDDTERQNDLERFFWPIILESTGASWSRLRQLVAGRGREFGPSVANFANLPGPAFSASPSVMSPPAAPPSVMPSVHVAPINGPATTRQRIDRYQRLIHDLQRSLDEEDLVRYRRLIEAAARWDWDDELRPRVLEFPRTERPSFSALAVSDVSPSISLAERRAEFVPAERPLYERSFASSTFDFSGADAVPFRAGEPSDPSPADVGKLAYILWEKNGRPIGRDQQFWFEAEETLRQRRKRLGA